MAKATTIRFSDEVFARLDQASARIGMPVNSIVVAACLEWMQRHTPDPALPGPGAMAPAAFGIPVGGPPRWATLRRAVKLATGKGSRPFYPFERFTVSAQGLLTAAQKESEKSGHTYIGTEHLLLACFADRASHAAMVLASLGVQENDVRAKLDQVVGQGGQRTILPMMVPTTRVKQVIELAFRSSNAKGEASVNTGHIVLALSSEGEGIAAHLLNDVGATPERIESALKEITEPEA